MPCSTAEAPGIERAREALARSLAERARLAAAGKNTALLDGLIEARRRALRQLEALASPPRRRP